MELKQFPCSSRGGAAIVVGGGRVLFSLSQPTVHLFDEQLNYFLRLIFINKGNHPRHPPPPVRGCAFAWVDDEEHFSAAFTTTRTFIVLRPHRTTAGRVQTRKAFRALPPSTDKEWVGNRRVGGVGVANK